jgi:acetyl esterase/lipase
VQESRVLYTAPHAGPFSLVRDLVYRVGGDGELSLDLYRPTEVTAPLPIVVFVHGDGPAEIIRDIKDWGQYVSWGELTASTGFAAVTFNHRSSQRRTRMHDVASDIDAALEYVTSRAEEWGLDASRMGLWSCSMGVPFATRAAFEHSSSLRCLVALYGPMDLTRDSRTDESVAEEALQEFSALHHLRSGRDLPPLLLARAGRDDPLLNQSIDAFVSTALERNLEVDVLNHPTGEHGFDVENDCRRTRDVIEAVINFYRAHL